MDAAARTERDAARRDFATDAAIRAYQTATAGIIRATGGYPTSDQFADAHDAYARAYRAALAVFDAQHAAQPDRDADAV